MRIDAARFAPLITWLYRVWCATLRIELVNWAGHEQARSQGIPLVFALWHDELFTLTHLRGDLPLCAVVSRSGDGEVLARVLEALGVRTARGSSSRGGLQALRTAMEFMRQGRHAVVTVDGPRGPRHEVKDGAVYLAFKAKAQIVPVRLFLERRHCFGSWDRFQLPWPFSRVRIVFGDPYEPAPVDGPKARVDTERIERGKRELAEKLEQTGAGLDFDATTVVE